MKTYKDFLAERCWPGHKPVPGKKPYTPGSCVKEEFVTESQTSKTGIVQTDVYGAKAYHARCMEPGCDWESRRYDKIKQAQDAAKKHAQQHFTKKSNVKEEVNEDWQKVNKADKTDGLSQKAVNAYRRENPGSKLKTAVTEKNPTGKRASRRKSFCSRMGGMKKRLTNPENARDPDSPINKALRRWNC